jgi:Skp family chaperone for outer membrane proteins
MRKLLKIVLLAAVLAGLGAAAFAADQKIALFNLRKAFDRYYKTMQSQAAIKQEVAEVQKELEQMAANEKKHKDDWRQLIDKADDQAISSDERAKGKKAAEEKYAELENDEQNLTVFDRSATARLHEKERQRRDDIVKEILGVVTAHAKAGGYALVLDTSGESANMAPVVLYSTAQDDLTETIIKELNAAAPPGSLDTDTNTAALPFTNNLLKIGAPVK